ncbi:hypothetical protein [Candidatus Poriferisocius sp.]|uniref:hypothetical protein n=1 Tax=Candidatus Poriferisocius sp. TaxID=3101276 RepID=UPI003B5A6893
MQTATGDRRVIDTMARQLDLCRTAPGQAAAVLVDQATDPAMADAAVAALEQLGLSPTTVVVDDQPPGGGGAAGTPPEVIVSLLAERLEDFESMIAPQAKVLSVVAPGPGELQGVVPHPGLSRRVRRGLELLDAGGELQVSSTQGTNLSIALQGARRWHHDGLAARPGTVAQWPRGVIGTAPAMGSANGTVVMAPGDIWLPLAWYARSTVTLTFEGGRMVGIEGPRSETDAVRAHLASLDNPSAYRFDAVEIGMLWIDQRRSPALFEPGLAESFGVADRYGHVVIATGDDATRGIACCLRNATVAVDEVAAVRSGRPQGELAPDVYEQAAHRYPLDGDGLARPSVREVS